VNAHDSSLSVARGRRLRRRSVVVLACCVALYAAAQLGLVLALDHWHPTWTESWREHKWDQLRQLAEREPDRPLLVMLGSSRTDADFDAARLDGLPGPGGKPFLAYNFGLPMVGPLREGLYLDEMLAAGIRPRAVLIEFVPALLNQPEAGLVSEENWIQPAWLSLSELCHLWPYWSHPRRKGRAWLEARLAPWYALRKNLLTPVFADVVPEVQGVCPLRAWLRASDWETWPHDDRGYCLPHSFRPEELHNAWLGAWRRYGANLKHFKPGPLPIQALRDLLARCRREQIATVLIFMPESGMFRSWYRPGGLDEARHLFGELSREYGALAIDASEWISDWDFGDGHHLQGEGTQVFTDWLIAALRPFLAGLREEGRPAATAARVP
jgi:hypothetical protein